MPRRERDRELARRRKRKDKKRKLRAKELLSSPGGKMRTGVKKTTEKVPITEPPQEEPKEPLSEG